MVNIFKNLGVSLTLIAFSSQAAFGAVPRSAAPATEGLQRYQGVQGDQRLLSDVGMTIDQAKEILKRSNSQWRSALEKAHKKYIKAGEYKTAEAVEQTLERLPEFRKQLETVVAQKRAILEKTERAIVESGSAENLLLQNRSELSQSEKKQQRSIASRDGEAILVILGMAGLIALCILCPPFAIVYVTWVAIAVGGPYLYKKLKDDNDEE